MYLHLGEDCLVNTKDIVGIFDLEKASISKKTKEFLVEAAKRSEVTTVSYEMPKTFIITSKKGKNSVYISQLSAATLYKRQKSKTEGQK